MNKVAMGALRYCHRGLFGSLLFELAKEAADGELTWVERRNIRRAARKLQQKTPKEVEQIAGRGSTPGQIKRRIGIGTGLVMGAGLARRAIARPELFRQGIKGLRQMLAPKELAGDLVTGATIYGLGPGAIRRADVEAAKRGKF